MAARDTGLDLGGRSVEVSWETAKGGSRVEDRSEETVNARLRSLGRAGYYFL